MQFICNNCNTKVYSKYIHYYIIILQVKNYTFGFLYQKHSSENPKNNNNRNSCYIFLNNSCKRSVFIESATTGFINDGNNIKRGSRLHSNLFHLFISAYI